MRTSVLPLFSARTVSTMNGQCHRYHEYERRPTHCIGLVLRARENGAWA